nr:protein kinase [Deltaproteobacteria bacterium]
MRQCPKCGKRFLESNARSCDVDGAVLDLLVVASERDRLVGTTILGRYAVDGVLGDGGMGVVYSARDTESGGRYAVKVLRAEYSAEEDLVVRFEQEARAAASINNPHIVEIYDWGSLPDNSRFFVMEYLEGRSLGDVLARMPKPAGSDRRQPMSEEFTIHLAMQICEGLGAAHAIGIVHRDIKPDNFHIVRKPDEPYFVKILDFGIAKVQNSKAARTRTGSVFGTPHYMSPEQASGDRNIDHKTDIYGLGVMMYEMASGKVPFDADNLMGILTAHLYHTPVHPRVYPECERMSPAFEAVILKCLAKTKEARYDSLDDVREDLERVRAGESSRALDDSDQATAQFHRGMLPGLQAAGPSSRRPGLETIPPALEGDTWVRPSPIMESSFESSLERSSAPTMGPPSVRPVPVDTAPGVSVEPALRPSGVVHSRWGWLLAGAVVSAGVMLGVGGYALVGRAPTPPDEVPPSVVPAPRPATPTPPLPGEPVRPRIVPPSVPAVAPTATSTIEVRTNVTERGRVLRGRSGNEVIGEINPQALELPRPRGAAQAFRIEVDGYETAVVELRESDPPVVLVPLSESPRRRHHRPDAAPSGVHARPLAPLVPTAPTPPSHTDGLRDPWNN